MPDYRSFPLDKNGRIAAPCVGLQAHDDDAAIAHATRELSDKDASLWNGTWRVATLKTARERKHA